MTMWLVAEDQVQIVQADTVITFTVVSVKPTGIEHANVWVGQSTLCRALAQEGSSAPIAEGTLA